jgi:hypothetical protein
MKSIVITFVWCVGLLATAMSSQGASPPQRSALGTDYDHSDPLAPYNFLRKGKIEMSVFTGRLPEYALVAAYRMPGKAAVTITGDLSSLAGVLATEIDNIEMLQTQADQVARLVVLAMGGRGSMLLGPWYRRFYEACASGEPETLRKLAPFCAGPTIVRDSSSWSMECYSISGDGGLCRYIVSGPSVPLGLSSLRVDVLMAKGELVPITTF